MTFRGALVGLLALALSTGSARAEELGFWDSVRTPDAEPKLLDERFEPTALVRTIFSYTMDDTLRYQDEGGRDRVIHAKDADPSVFGYRRGFTLDTVEFGARGRFNGPGIYYAVKFSLVPREKDGNRSSDYLQDAYLGWNPYRLFDVRVGRMKIPFSQVNLKHTGHTWLIYKPTLDVLSPKRQLGAQLALSDPWGVARLAGGVYNSVAAADEQMKSFDRLMYVGRLELDVARLLDVTGVGLDDFALRLGGSLAFTSEDFDKRTEHRWLGVDAHVRWWLFALEAEYLVLDFFWKREGGLTADQGTGWHVDFRAEAWPERLTVNLRVEQTDGDSLVRGAGSDLSIGERAMQKKRWITAGVSFFLDKRARVDLNYVYREWLEGNALRDDVIMAMFQYDM